MMKVPRTRRQSATISDVAHRAGVSAMTVSRALNGSPRISAETRSEVMKVAREMNYVPNQAARSLASGSLRRLGLLYSNPSAAYLSELLIGCLDQARLISAQLLVEKCGGGISPTDALERLLAGGVAGVIVPPPLSDDLDLLAQLRRAAVPAVRMATSAWQADFPAVSIDDAAAAHAMTAHLLALGHRRICFIAGPPDQHASLLRLRGCQDAMSRAGVEWEPKLVAVGDFSYRSGLDAAEKLLSLDEPPTALFAANDDMAAGALAIAHGRGIEVPSDLSVCGFDDTALASCVWPLLTTIRQPIAAMARRGIELLDELARGDGHAASGMSALFPFELVRRQSDAIPRRRR